MSAVHVQLLASRRIPPHYDEADLDEDVVTLREMGRAGLGAL